MNTKKQQLLYGAHISTSGGFDQAIIRGESIGCTTIQIFTKSNRQWASKSISAHEAEAFKQAYQKSSIRSVVAHASYLINCAASNPELLHKSMDALVEEINRCTLLGIPYLILHPGSRGIADEQESIYRIISSLDYALENSQQVTILLENMAGQGSSIGATFEQLAAIRNQARHKSRIGICFDTCHAFAAGYDLRTPTTYEKTWSEFDKIIGLEHLKAMHINDSKKELGSRVDRHTDIGDGELTTTAFSLIFNDERFFDVPKILETPKDSLEDDARNMRILRSLLSEKTESRLL